MGLRGEVDDEDQRSNVGLGLAALVPDGARRVAGCSYNRFVGQEEAIKAQWAQVENQLQRRNDLIPNLVETVKGYASHEERRVQGRRRLARPPRRCDAHQRSDRGRQRADLRARRLLAVVENYPQLKANEQFNRLMDELSGTENRIAVERMRYNERVQDYNTQRRQFPANLTASVFGFEDIPVFQGAGAGQAGTESFLLTLPFTVHRCPLTVHRQRMIAGT